MLIALFMLFLLTNGPAAEPNYFVDLQDKIESAIQSDDRKPVARKILDDMETRAESHNETTWEVIKKFTDLIDSREATTDEVVAIFERHLENSASYSSDILDLRFDLKDQMSREEWGEAFSVAK
jgi:hypothetical protein